MNIPVRLPRQLARLAAMSPCTKRLPPVAAALVATNVTVTATADEWLDPAAREATRPAHHLNNSQTKFTNPWPSFRQMRALDMATAVCGALAFLSPPRPYRQLFVDPERDISQQPCRAKQRLETYRSSDAGLGP